MKHAPIEKERSTTSARSEDRDFWTARLAQGAYLSELIASAHRELLDAVVKLENCSNTDQPVFEAVAEARWRLSKADRHRRTIVAKAVEDAISAGWEPTHQALLKLSSVRQRLDEFRTAYVSHWTSDRVRADWAGYRVAREEKCQLLRDSMASERQLIAQLVFAS